MKQDTVVSGALSGIAGSLAQLIFGIISKMIGFTDRAFIEFAKIFFMYKNYKGTLALMVGVIVHFMIGMILGVLFTYLIKLTSKKYYYLKGIGFGVLFWLGFGVAGTILKLPLFTRIPPKPALSTLIGAILYGFFTAYVFRLIEKKTEI